MKDGESVMHPIAPNRAIWVQVAKGAIQLNGQPLYAGDGAAIAEETAQTLQGTSNESEVLLFDMAA